MAESLTHEERAVLRGLLEQSQEQGRNRFLPNPLVALASLAIAAVCFFFLLVGWQRGFSEGARQVTDQILAAQTQSTEVVQLRAQIDEMRRAGDQISNTLLAAFAAGIAVLVVVNIGVVIVAQQNYERDKDALRTVVINEAEKLDQESFQNWSSALAQRDLEIRAHTDQQIARVQERQVAVDARIDQIAEMAAAGSRVASAASASVSMTAGDEWARFREPVLAALHYSLATARSAEGNEGAVSLWTLGKTIASLREAGTSSAGPDEILDSIVKNLRSANAAMSGDPEFASHVHEALSLVEQFRSLRDAQDTGYSPTPPPP